MEIKKDGYYATAILSLKKESSSSDAFQSLATLASETKKEKGNLLYVVQIDRKETNKIIIWEAFQDEDSFNYHLNSKHLKAFMDQNYFDFISGYETKIL